MTQLHFDHVSFTYAGLVDRLLDDVSFAVPSGWTGVVGANGAGKTTLLKLAAGQLVPSRGTIAAPEPAVFCEQRTDDAPRELFELLCFPDADAGRIASLLSLDGDWQYRWHTLSHGERKRAQIAVALWRRPDLFVVDEPTNHLDRDARSRLLSALERYPGVGLIVSHDRDLLDRLCGQCLFFEASGRVVLRPGGVTKGLADQERERLARERSYDRARDDAARIETEAARRRAAGSAQNRKRSKRHLARNDSDGRERIDRARVSGADGRAGRLASQLDGRREQAAARLGAAERPVRERVGVSVHGRRGRSDRLLHRSAGSLNLADGRVLQLPELEVRPEDRIVLEGPNGAGKSTLVARLLDERGADDSIVWIPQEISEHESRRLMQGVRALGSDELARIVSTVSRLGSDPRKLLETESPSPGETRKLMLALGLEQVPELIVMDEPTNHLDLVSMRCVEEALAGFTGALLLVSHDERFIRDLVRTRWRITPGGYLQVSDRLPG